MRPLVLLTLAFLATVAGAAETPIGSVKEVSGAAFIHSGGARRAAALAGPVFRDDTLETGANGALGVLFVDDSRLSLGPDTSLTIDEYVFTPAAKKGSFVSRLGRGTLLYVSGLIAKLSPQSAAIETPVGTVGIRGTKLLVVLEGVQP
ncbi:MAG: FecR domain-containing protein [Acidobacteriota bacterium]|nr:FecR domain-containing protein [Acidobacteriota bacterium]MDH3522639.1 FecR domain-containing protein [Acidobacteriota bacterium]